MVAVRAAEHVFLPAVADGSEDAAPAGRAEGGGGGVSRCATRVRRSARKESRCNFRTLRPKERKSTRGPHVSAAYSRKPTRHAHAASIPAERGPPRRATWVGCEARARWRWRWPSRGIFFVRVREVRDRALRGAPHVRRRRCRDRQDDGRRRVRGDRVLRAWCPHCQNFGPTWETVAAYFNKGEGTGALARPRASPCSPSTASRSGHVPRVPHPRLPHGAFGTLAQFKAEKEKENAARSPSCPRAGGTCWTPSGRKRAGRTLHSEAHTAEARATEARAKAAAAAGLKEKEGGAETKATKAREPPRADLLDVAVATARAFGEMTSPALLRPETRPAFFGFVDLLASAHPLRVCVDGARAIVDAFDELWPAEDGDMAGVRARLAEARVCGDGLDALFAKTAPTVSTSETGKAGTNAGSGSQSRDDALVRAHPWRSCAGSVEGTRGYTCGLWTLLHTLAARARVPKAARRGSRRRRAGSSTSSRATTAARTSWRWPRRFRAAKSSPRATRSSGCGGRTTKSTRGWRRARRGARAPARATPLFPRRSGRPTQPARRAARSPPAPARR